MLEDPTYPSRASSILLLAENVPEVPREPLGGSIAPLTAQAVTSYLRTSNGTSKLSLSTQFPRLLLPDFRSAAQVPTCHLHQMSHGRPRLTVAKTASLLPHTDFPPLPCLSKWHRHLLRSWSQLRAHP